MLCLSVCIASQIMLLPVSVYCQPNNGKATLPTSFASRSCKALALSCDIKITRDTNRDTYESDSYNWSRNSEWIQSIYFK